LQYQFCTLDGKVCSKLEMGSLAGSFNFQDGDEISVQVTAISALNVDKNNPASNILTSIEVQDCTLLSLAARMDEPLSMFDENNAAIYIKGKKWDPFLEAPQSGDNGKNIQRLQQSSKKPLSVVTKKGQWQLSGYLSITMKTQADDSLSRLYFFDPESSTGSAGGFG